jgi:hypothetical protein
MMDDIITDMKKTDPEKFLPKLLMTRLHFRELTTVILAFYSLFSILYLTLGVVYIDSAFDSYKYSAYRIPEFWAKYNEGNIKNKEIQLLASFSGIFSICLAVFSFMCCAVMLKHILKGGLKMRLEAVNFVNIIVQSIMFGYSILPIARHPGFNLLNYILFPISAINIAATILLFVYIKRIVNSESEYLLSLGILYQHRREYWDDYLKKNNIREMRTDAIVRRI